MAIPSLLAAAVTDVGKVRGNNEDAHWLDADKGLAIVCDGMGGHQAGEVASNLAVDRVRERWAGAGVEQARVTFARTHAPSARMALVRGLREAVLAANAEIIGDSDDDEADDGMGTTFTGVCFVPGEALIAHAGDSRAYLVRDGATTQLTEDHTLLARLADAGVETGPDANRWKGVVTNALGVGEPTWIAISAARIADGDRLLLCSVGISEYFAPEEIATVLTKVGSPAKAARKLVEVALARGGADNATAVVIKVVEAGATPLPPSARREDDEALARCPLFAELTPARRLRVLALATEHTLHDGEPMPPRLLGDRVAWIVLSGRVVHGSHRHKAGGLVYPECLIAGRAAPEDEWTARGEVRALAILGDDLLALAADELDLGDKLLPAIASALPRGG